MTERSEGRNEMVSRRNFLNASAMSAVAIAAVGSRATAASIPEAATMKDPTRAPAPTTTRS